MKTIKIKNEDVGILMTVLQSYKRLDENSKETRRFNKDLERMRGRLIDLIAGGKGFYQSPILKKKEDLK